jgi:hypothetical protein
MTSRENNDALLWEVGRKLSEREDEELLAEEIAAYRQGRLSVEAAEELERQLGQSPEGRRQMARLAGCEPAAPAAGVRERLMASLPPARSQWASRTWAKAAAIFAVGCSVFLLTRAPAPLPDELTYDVAAEGLEARRGPSPGAREVEAYPETRIRITASPRPAAVKGVEFGLYRQSDARLERIGFGDGVSLEVIRGAAVISARADDLANPAQASTRLFLVAAPPGDLPGSFELKTSDAHGALERQGRRRAYPVEIRLVAPSEAR